MPVTKALSILTTVINAFPIKSKMKIDATLLMRNYIQFWILSKTDIVN